LKIKGVPLYNNLEFLPLYSPGLNPIESLWRLARRQSTTIRCFPYFHSIEVVLTTFESFFESLQAIK
jgi:transposase